MGALAQVEEWTDEDEAELMALEGYELEAERLDPYIRRITPRLPPPKHLAPLIDLLERTRKGPVYAVVEMPPRHAKTTTAVNGLSWRLMLDPALHHAFIAYSEALSLTKSRAVRRQAIYSGVQLQGDAKNVHHWETEQGGSFLATSIGGSLTGKGITGIAVVDDPHKDRAEAESALLRDKVWDWFTDTFWTRLEDSASVIVIQTRWHKDDLVGRLLKGFTDPETGETIEFERIKLSALAEEDDSLGREPGEALWPERFPTKKLHGIRSIMGPYGFSALYQQSPIAKGSQLFGDHPSRFKLKDWKLDGHRVIVMCDPAASEKTSADHSAILVVAVKGYGENMEAWVIDHYRKQILVPGLVRVLKAFQRKYWGVAVGVEAVAGFKAVPQMLRDADSALKVMDVTPLGDKWTRAQPVSSAWNEARVHIPMDVPWGAALMAEVTDFTPGAKVDDRVDCLSHAWNTLYADKPPRPKRARRDRRQPFG
jgi:predicted phage terminase large subunit-like protein